MTAEIHAKLITLLKGLKWAAKASEAGRYARGSVTFAAPQFPTFQQYRRQADVAYRGLGRLSWTEGRL
jgi:hypothetical protein